ncbi:uncharacterized protein V1516DRAFT_713749 [Lipomyces oligophaga]|uniref:uncharacterized protein n=1 Tax=Lipomyces oligophaga TaxID=45792 RepID=UPI0034CFEA3E
MKEYRTTKGSGILKLRLARQSRKTLIIFGAPRISEVQTLADPAKLAFFADLYRRYRQVSKLVSVQDVDYFLAFGSSHASFLAIVAVVSEESFKLNDANQRCWKSVQILDPSLDFSQTTLDSDSGAFPVQTQWKEKILSIAVFKMQSDCVVQAYENRKDWCLNVGDIVHIQNILLKSYRGKVSAMTVHASSFSLLASSDDFRKKLRYLDSSALQQLEILHGSLCLRMIDRIRKCVQLATENDSKCSGSLVLSSSQLSSVI